MEKEEIGKKIKILRKTRGLTQQQLADKLKVKRATISNYEIGRRSPHIKELEDISEALGVNLEYFGFGGSAAVDLVARAKVLFESDAPAEEKAQAYKEIMRLYLQVEDE
jgi:transcriptional regulator with XRE-family HTH domain